MELAYRSITSLLRKGGLKKRSTSTATKVRLSTLVRAPTAPRPSCLPCLQARETAIQSTPHITVKLGNDTAKERKSDISYVRSEKNTSISILKL